MGRGRRNKKTKFYSNLELVYPNESSVIPGKHYCTILSQKEYLNPLGRKHRIFSEAENNSMETVIHKPPGMELLISKSHINTVRLHGMVTFYYYYPLRFK